MLKLLLGLLGLVETLYPERFLRLLTRLSYDYEGEAPVAKPWVVTAARIEGLVILGIVVYSALKADCSLLCRSADDETAEKSEKTSGSAADSVDRIN